MDGQKKELWQLVALGEKSQLKVDLNRGVASLCRAEQAHLVPHLCLNRKEGLGVISQIAANPEEADTDFSITSLLKHDGGTGLWLNVSFTVFVGKLSSDSILRLTPRQTSHIVCNLPAESKQVVLEKIKQWYFNYLFFKLQQGMESIAKQFNEKNLLLVDDFFNRIFDIQKIDDGRDTPYTEWDIAGSELFLNLFFGRPLSYDGPNGYEGIDAILGQMDGQRKVAADSMLALIRALVALR